MEVAGDSKEKLSVFLENFLQEMPKAHLELLHSGSLSEHDREGLWSTALQLTDSTAVSCSAVILVNTVTDIYDTN